MIAAYQRISRADGDLGKDGKDKSNSMRKSGLRYILSSDNQKHRVV